MEARAIVLLLVLPAAIAGPVQRQGDNTMCASRCPDASKFRYQTGTNYVYNYEAETRTTMAGAAEDTATITIRATANIHVLQPCEMALQLTEVVIKRSHEQNPSRMVIADNMSRARRALEDRSLRFAFLDGAVGDLCPEEDEDLWALNVKRGVLTSFQNSMRQLDREEHVQEADVTGQCPTHYKVTQQGWKSLTVTKVKDMLSCTSRNDHRTSLMSAPYEAPNSLQSLPLMKSSHECTHDISKEDGILSRSACHEVHVFRPFSKANSGAVTEVSQTLALRSRSSGISTRRGAVTSRTSLLFQHKQGMDRGDSVFFDVKNKLKEICQLTQTDIRPQVPHVLGELVHMMRGLDYSDLQDLDQELQGGSLCPDNSVKTRKFFQDALPMTATGASLRLMSDFLISGEVKDAQATFWLTSLAFLPNPTKDMIAAVQPVLENSGTQQDSMLAVSALVNNYCQREANCTQDREVTQVLDTLTRVLGSSCQVTEDNFQQVLLTLRAIGNIGRSQLASLRLQPCFTQSDLPMDVRVAALEAYRRMPCNADRNDVMETFLRQSEDSEVRVAAYLAAMKCPSDAVLGQVRQALLEEKVNQVGSFVWTHLTNLLETESPHKQAIRDLLENELLKREFSLDRLKYSRNTELSFFSDKFNLGGAFESNVVWSSNSFIPRSAMVNLTVDMFGHSVNLLEVGGRVQGLEYLLQTYFGPSEPDADREAGYGRSDLVKSEKITRTKQRYGEVKDDLRAQLYLRVMGNELAFSSVEGRQLSKLREGQAKAFFDDLAAKLIKDGEVSLTQSAMFLDTSIIIPTAVGVPLNLTVNGTAAMELQASQKMDFKKINAKSKAFEVAVALQPSGAVEVASMMSVDAFVTHVGLKMTSRLHTSTSVKGRVELARGQILNVELDTPRDNLEIFDFQSKFHIVHDQYEKEQQMVRTNRKEKQACTGQALARLLGMELCASLAFPNATTALTAPYFPFTGPTSVSVTLRKHDVHSGYKLLAKQIKTSSSIITQVALDTPGSRVDRAVSLGYVASLKDKTLEADLLSPWKKASAKVKLTNTKKSMAAKATVTIDTDKEYKVTANLAKDIRQRKDLMAKLKPSLEVSSPEGVLLSANGNVDYREKKLLKTSLVVEMKDVLKKPISVDYSLNMRERNQKKTYKNIVKLTSQFATVRSSMQALVGSLKAKKRSALLMVRSHVDYNLHAVPSIKRNIVHMAVKVHDRTTPAITKYGIQLTVDAKRTPQANVVLKGEVSHKKTLTEMEVTVRHGQNAKLKSGKDKELVVAGFVSHKIANPQALVRFDVKAVYPDKGLEYQVKGKHRHDKQSMEDYFTVHYAKGKSVDAHMRLDRSRSKRSGTFDLSYPAGQNYPARTVKLNADLTKKSEKHHIFSALAMLQKGEKNSVVVSFKQPANNSVEITSELGIHNRRPVKLDLAGNFALRNMKGEGKLVVEGKTYTLNYTSDIQRDRYAKFAMDFSHPERRITAAVEGGRDLEESVKRGKVEVIWDADNDPTQKAGVTMEMADTVDPDDVNVGGMLEVFTPVENYQHLKGELRFENSGKKILTVADAVLGEDSDQYSAKFLLRKPVTKDNFRAQVSLKTPFIAVPPIELKVDHRFDESGELATALKGVYGRDFVAVDLKGRWQADLITRVYNLAASLDSRGIEGAERIRLTFNHRDANGHFNTQTVADVNGDQYMAIMEADFQKVHWQITTSGEVSIRAPQLSSASIVSWTHRNSLHDVDTDLTLRLPSGKSVHLEVGGNANIVSETYEGNVKLRGPWNPEGAEHTSVLQINFSKSQSGYEAKADLQLDRDTYVAEHSRKSSRSGMRSRSTLTMSRFPQYSCVYTSLEQLEDFPYMMSVELQVAEQPMLNVDVELENPSKDQYRSNSKLVLHLEDSVKNVALKARHTKNRRDQWVTRGDLSYEVGKTVSFTNVVDVFNERKMIRLEVDSPYDELRNIELEYSHSGNVEDNFRASCSLAVEPYFDEVTAAIEWSNRDQFSSNLKIETPFKELRYLQVNGQRENRGGKYYSTLTVEHHPRQVYKLDTAYSVDFPRDVDMTINISTPRRELPSLNTHMAFQYTDSEVSGQFQLAGPRRLFQDVSTSFTHRRGPTSVFLQTDMAMGPNTLSSRLDIDWEDVINGTFTLAGTYERHNMDLLLSHKGQSWEDFRTKASFKMNGDRLESEVAYSNRDGRSGLFMLATPDPDIDFFKTTFFQRLTDDQFELQCSAQYGETSKPYELGLSTTYNDDRVGFSADLKTPHTEDLEIELGFAGRRRVEVKLLGMYGSNDKVDILVKYHVRRDFWDVGGEFEYLIQGEGRSIGLSHKREGPWTDVRCSTHGKYMGKQVTVNTQYKQADTRSGRVDVLTNFEGYTNLAASFDNTGDSENSQSNVFLKYRDDKEASASLDLRRNKWKRLTVTSIFNLPIRDYEENKLTYKHTYRRNTLSAEAALKLGRARPISGELNFEDNTRLSVSITGPHKDFQSFSATGTFDETDKRLEGEATMRLVSQEQALTATYNVRAGIWPVMVNVQATTPFDGWRSVELTTTHDGDLTDFTSSHTLKAEAVGTVNSEMIWTYTSPAVLDGLWTLTSTIEGAQDLKLNVRNTQAGDEYRSSVTVGWELLKEIVLETQIQLGDRSSANRYSGSLALSTPFPEASQLGVSFDHSHSDIRIQDNVVATFNDKTYLDADFDYSVDDKRVGSLLFREPRPMEFLIGGRYTENTGEGELLLNWDKRVPEMNIHLTGEYTDRTDGVGTDTALKVWAMHPARTMGVEYLLKGADKEFMTDVLFTWDKSNDQTLSYIINWTDRSSRYSTAYDAMVKVGVPMRSVQVEGVYSNTGRVHAAEGAVLWDADRDKNMKVGLKGQLDKRGNTKKVQLGLDLPFVDKEYSLTTETGAGTGSTLLDATTQFSYSPDPRKLVVLTTRVDDVSYGSDATNYSVAVGLVHPMTDVNIHLTSHVGNARALCNMASKVVYLTADREEKTMELRGQIDKLRKQMSMEVRSPMKDLSLEGQLTSDREHNIRITSFEDGQRSQVTDVMVNTETRTFELAFRYDKAAPSKTLNLWGHMATNKMLQAELYSLDNGQRVSETLMTVRLNSSQVLHTRFNWRPRMLTDLQQYVGTQLTVFSYGSSEAFRSAAQAVGREVEAKYQAIMQEVRVEAGPLLQQFQQEMQDLQQHLDAMQRDMRRFYNRNSLHVQDLGQVASDLIESVVSGMQMVVMQFNQFQTQLQQDIAQSMEQLGQYPMAQRYAQLVSDLATNLMNTRAVLERAMNALSVQVAHFSDVSYRKYLAISRQIDRKLQGYTAALRQTPQYQQLAQAYSTARSSLSQMSQGDYQQLAEAANLRLLMALDKLGLKESYLAMVSRSKQLIADQFHDLVQRPEVQQIYVIGNEIYQQGVWAYQYWHVDRNMKMAVAQLLELAKDVALLEITRIKNSIVDLDKSRVIVFDPENGELQFEIYLPVPLKSLSEPPDVRVDKYINRIRSWAATYIPTPSHSMWTTINTYLPNMDTDTWLPPYTAHAYIMGDQHVVTFDQKHYSFAGRCSYILARDMADDRFTVVVNYNNRPRQPQVQSIVVLLRGVAIEVDIDSKVKMNNQERELPFFSGVISAVRKGSVVRVQDAEALTVDIDTVRGIYSVALSGWYHGRTAGLLGTYDNEPFNDFTSSNRQLTEDVEAFTNSWEVSRRYCRSRNLADSAQLDPGTEEVQACQKFLAQSSSYFAPCFGQVEASEMVGVCVNYVRAGATLQEAKCRAGQQYRYMCQRHGIGLGTPAECVRCELPGNVSLARDQSTEVSAESGERRASADVVFVVEEAECNSWAQQALPTLASQLASSLTARGVAASRFGLVSYSGNASRDQQLVHTIEGGVFGDPSNFLKATESLRLTSTGGGGDVSAALREAVKYPFRVGVAKMLVLLPCSACSGDLYSVGQVLTSHGFVLHVLSDQDFAVEDSNSRPVRVFGLDSTKAHTQRSAARRSGAIFDQLKAPSGSCAQLALSTNGSVFDVTHMQGRSRIQSEFMESFATRGAVGAVSPSCEVCSCHDDGSGRGHTVCRLCTSGSWLWNHIPSWLQSSSTNVIGVFNDIHHQVITSLQVPESEVALAA